LTIEFNLYNVKGNRVPELLPGHTQTYIDKRTQWTNCYTWTTKVVGMLLVVGEQMALYELETTSQ